MTDGAPVEPSELARTGPIRRRLHFVLGVVFLAIAVLGVLLPLLPTTPFLLLASYSFARSQPRLQQWLRRSPVFGRLLEDWERARGVRKRVKIVAVLVVLAMVALALWKQQAKNSCQPKTTGPHNCAAAACFLATGKVSCADWQEQSCHQF